MVILTDLSEVLIRGLYGTQDILAEKYGSLAGEAFWARHESTYGKFQELMRGKITEAEYWDYFFRGQSFPFDYKAVDKAFKNNLGRTIPIRSICICVSLATRTASGVLRKYKAGPGS